MRHSADSNAIADTQRTIATNAYPATQNDVLTDRGTTNDSAAATDNTVLTDPTIVTDLHLIIDFHAVTNDRIAQRATVYRGIRPYAHVSSKNDGADLRDALQHTLIVGRITKTLGTDHRIGVHDTIVAYFCAITDNHTWV